MYIKDKTISQTNKKKSVPNHFPRVVDRHRNHISRWRIFAQDFESVLLKRLRFARFAARSLRENDGRPFVFFDVFGKTFDGRNCLFSIGTIDQNRTAMTKVV